MRREQDELRKAGIDVVLVGSGSPEKAGSFRHDFEVPFPIVCDPDCVLYKKYGLKDMKTCDFFSPSLAVKTLKVLAEGYGHKSGQGPERQLPGVFIIDTGGKVRFAHYAADAADNPSPQELIQAAAALSKVRSGPTCKEGYHEGQ